MAMSIETKPEHEVAYQDLAALLKDKAEAHGLSSLEVLAVASNMVGKLVAMQDQRTVTPDHAMSIVALNIKLGNQQVLEMLRETQSTRQ
jgi:hypothetical protein